MSLGKSVHIMPKMYSKGSTCNIRFLPCTVSCWECVTLISNACFTSSHRSGNKSSTFQTPHIMPIKSIHPLGPFSCFIVLQHWITDFIRLLINIKHNLMPKWKEKWTYRPKVSTNKWQFQPWVSMYNRFVYFCTCRLCNLSPFFVKLTEVCHVAWEPRVNKSYRTFWTGLMSLAIFGTLMLFWSLCGLHRK